MYQTWQQEYHDGCHIWNTNSLSFASTWGTPVFLVGVRIAHLFSFLSPHFTYSLHARWHIRPWCTTIICICLWLLFLPLFSCSSPRLSLFVSTALLQIVSDIPTLRFRSVCHINDVAQILLLFIRKTTPPFCIIISVASWI